MCHHLSSFLGILNLMFNTVYDLDLVGETVYSRWQKHGVVTTGKGVAIESTKEFFEWLNSADQESDEEGGVRSGDSESRTAS